MIRLIWRLTFFRYFLVAIFFVAFISFSLVLLWPPQVLIYSADFGGGENDFNISSYTFARANGTVPLSAESYLIADLEGGEVVVGKNSQKVLPIASITKLMTAIVALDILPADYELTVSQSAYNTYGNTGQLRVGEKLKTQDLLYPLLLSSSNDAAEVLAEAVGRDKFMIEMNNKAQTIGLANTFFADPSGLSPANVSTAEDLVKFAVYLHRHHPDLINLTTQREYRLGRHHWTNLNNVSLMKNFLGGKNGYTEEANRTLLAIFEVPIDTATTTDLSSTEKQSHLMILALLQSSDRLNDVRNLLNYLVNYASYLGGKNGFVPIKPDSSLKN